VCTQLAFLSSHLLSAFSLHLARKLGPHIWPQKLVPQASRLQRATVSTFKLHKHGSSICHSGRHTIWAPSAALHVQWSPVSVRMLARRPLFCVGQTQTHLGMRHAKRCAMSCPNAFAHHHRQIGNRVPFGRPEEHVRLRKCALRRRAIFLLRLSPTGLHSPLPIGSRQPFKRAHLTTGALSSD